MPEVIRCEGLTKRFGGVTAVDGLDLSVTGGQVYGFLGPNGSGKSTTMRMLIGLVHPSGGRALVDGRPVPDPAGLRHVGSLIEEPAWYPWLSGRRNLELVALAGPPLPARDAVDAALEKVGLTSVARRRVKTYSQGMRQRLGIAAALLRDPCVVLLDEPTNGMDPSGLHEFRRMLRDIAAGGATVFLSSHLLAEVQVVCDRVAVVHEGRLVAEGRVGDLTSRTRRVRVVLDDADLARARESLARWPLAADGAAALVVEQASGQEVNRVLTGAGIWPHEVSVVHPSLEEVFLHLTDDIEGVPGATAAL